MRESSTDEIEQLGVGRTVRLIVKRAGQTRTLDAEMIDISSTDGGRMPPFGASGIQHARTEHA